MLVRGGTAADHCVATGLVALGWHAILVEKRWPRGIALGLLGVAIHRAWNVAAGTQTLTALLTEDASAPSQSLFAGAAIAVMAGIWVVAVTGLFLAAQRPAPRQMAASAPEAAPPPEA